MLPAAVSATPQHTDAVATRHVLDRQCCCCCWRVYRAQKSSAVDIRDANLVLYLPEAYLGGGRGACACPFPFESEIFVLIFNVKNMLNLKMYS